ncbi:hypothetical protein GW17_00054341 [Ensete ventricosum]|nr:hypothetical protein GW17_00054341 [Ensete ventricosum]RZS14611.1 hypothetical protein BHM03_00046322 [Ensete ventricosum]
MGGPANLSSRFSSVLSRGNRGVLEIFASPRGVSTRRESEAVTGKEIEGGGVRIGRPNAGKEDRRLSQ